MAPATSAKGQSTRLDRVVIVRSTALTRPVSALMALGARMAANQLSVTVTEVRRATFGLLEVTGEPHHEIAPFRTQGRIIAAAAWRSA